MMNISKLTSTIPDDAEVALWNRTYEEAEASFRKLMADCVNVNVNATADAVKGILSLCSKKSDGTLEAPSSEETSRLVKSDPNDSEDTKIEKISKLIGAVTKNAGVCFEKQAAVTEAAGKGTDAALKWCEAHNKQHEIQIGMNLAKVQIEREWFNPGVFLLTNNMYNFSSSKISADNDTSFTSGNPEEIKKLFAEMNECIFPTYPVAFVIAKDVSIRFVSQTTMSASFAKSIEDHASQGGGFLIFSGNSSSSSSSGQSAATANSNANSVTVRFTAPQILGYYMQETPADKSIHINSTTDTDMSIIGFVSKFKEMIEDYNRTLRENRREKGEGER